jgi:hypothetical protein
MNEDSVLKKPTKFGWNHFPIECDPEGEVYSHKQFLVDGKVCMADIMTPGTLNRNISRIRDGGRSLIR